MNESPILLDARTRAAMTMRAALEAARAKVAASREIELRIAEAARREELKARPHRSKASRRRIARGNRK